MARPTSVHVCSACGHEAARWAGRCPGCGEWNTLVEEVKPQPRRGGGSGAGKSGAGRRRGLGRAGTLAQVPMTLGEVVAEEQARLTTGIGELDNVLGGGI